MTHLDEVEQAIDACLDGERPKVAARRANAMLGRLQRQWPDTWKYLTTTEGFDTAYLLNPYGSDAARRLDALRKIAAQLCIEAI